MIGCREIFRNVEEKFQYIQIIPLGPQSYEKTWE